MQLKQGWHSQLGEAEVERLKNLGSEGQLLVQEEYFLQFEELSDVCGPEMWEVIFKPVITRIVEETGF